MGAQARLEWGRMPRIALRSKVCGERSEDFCAAPRHKSNGIFHTCNHILGESLGKLLTKYSGISTM